MYTRQSKWCFPVFVLLLWVIYLATWNLSQKDKKHAIQNVPHVEESPMQRKSIPPCGQICEYKGERHGNDTSNSYPQLTKDINCTNILGRMAWEHKDIVYPPLEEPPSDLIQAFLQNGEASFGEKQYLNDVKWPKYQAWNEKLIKKMQEDDMNEKDISRFKTNGIMSKIIKKYKDAVSGGKGVVIGTQRPWLEAILLNAGAKQITTLEYSTMSIIHPHITIEHPMKTAIDFIEGKADYFDFGASFSSVEHSGLGRYGDAINPYGDLEAMAQVWCMTKPGGMFFLGVPMSLNGSSLIIWNANRVYGPARLAHLTANWQLMEQTHTPNRHGILVLKKTHRLRQK